MRKLITVLFILAATISYSQNNKGKVDDMGRIVLNAYVPDQTDGLTSSAKNSLENKLNQIATSTGMGGGASNPRFIITANVVVLTKDITPTAPPMQAYTLDVTLYIGDGIDGKKFASQTTTVKGVGENETRAYMAALKNLNPNDAKIKSFVESGKSKIIEYYNTNCDFILKEAQTLITQKEFDYAIYKLTGVPEVCLECYNKCMTAVGPIYQQKIDFECKTKLTEANTIWSAGQSWDAAERAGAILSTIDPDATCYKDSKVLAEKIGKRILEVDKREWSLKVEKEVDLQRDMIKAYRDVGTAYGNGQPKTVTYNVSGWW